MLHNLRVDQHLGGQEGAVKGPTYSDIVITMEDVLAIAPLRAPRRGDSLSSGCQPPFAERIKVDGIDGLAFVVPGDEKRSGFHDGIGEWPCRPLCRGSKWPVELQVVGCERGRSARECASGRSKMAEELLVLTRT